MTTEAIKTFLKRHEGKPQIDHVADFLNNQYKRKKSINFSYEQAVAKADLWVEAVNKKNSKKLQLGRYIFVKQLEDGFFLIQLYDLDSKKYEGFHMNHCVGTYSMDKTIYSVRNPQNIPKCTIEVQGNEIIQIKGRFNNEVDQKYVKYCIESLVYLNCRIWTFDISLLGYAKMMDSVKKDAENILDGLEFVKIRDEYFINKKNKVSIKRTGQIENPKYNHDLMDYLLMTGQCDELAFNLYKQANQEKKNSTLANVSIWGRSNLILDLIKLGGVINQRYYGAIINGAVSCRDHVVVKYLLSEVKFFVHSRGLLENACFNNDIEMVKLIFQYKSVDFDKKTDQAYRYAIFHGNLEIVKLMWFNNVRVHAINDILSKAKIEKRTEIFNFLNEVTIDEFSHSMVDMGFLNKK